jgi:hypothetical protein
MLGKGLIAMPPFFAERPRGLQGSVRRQGPVKISNEVGRRAYSIGNPTWNQLPGEGTTMEKLTSNGSGATVASRLDEEREVCTLYIESSKSFIQLSTGALLLSLAFVRDFLGASQLGLLRDWPLIVAWVSWLISILMGTTYQYCVIKYLETLADKHCLLYYPRSWRSWMPRILTENPFWLYGAMLVCFYLGILLFSCLAFRRAFG